LAFTVAKSGGDCAGLVVGQTAVALVKLRTRGRKTVVLSSTVDPIPEDGGSGAVAELLRSIAAREGLGRCRLFTCIPRHLVTTRVIDFPSRDEDEIAEMVRLKAPEYVPYSADEIIARHVMLAKEPEGYSRVMVAIVQREIVENHIAVLRDAGIETESVGISTLGLFNAIVHGDGVPEEGCVALVNLGVGGLDVAVARDAELVFTRGVEMRFDCEAGGEMDDDELREVALEVHRSLDAYVREAGRHARVEQIILTGDVGSCRVLAGTVEEITGVSVTTDGGRFQPVAQTGKASDAPLPPVALGLARNAVAIGVVQVDFTPDELISRRASVIFRRFAIRCGVTAALCVLLAVLLVRERLAQRERYVEFLDKRIAEIEPSALETRNKKKRVEVVKGQLDRKGSALEFLGDIHKLVPQGKMVLTDIRFEREKRASIRGRALDRNVVQDYVNALRSAGVPHLKRAEAGDMPKTTERNTPVVEFQINVPLGAENEQEVFADDGSAE